MLDEGPAGLGRSVRGHRLRRGWSQEDLADLAGVDVKTIRNIEAGRTRPRLSTLAALADSLHLDPTERERLITAGSAPLASPVPDGPVPGGSVPGGSVPGGSVPGGSVPGSPASGSPASGSPVPGGSTAGDAGSTSGRPSGPDGSRRSAGAAGSDDDPTPPGVVPAQLPADVLGFAGRARELSRLDAVLAAAADPASVPPALGQEPSQTGSAALVWAISGTAGVGKTTLVVHWAHRVADRFPDGQLYVNLRGFDPGDRVMPVAEAIAGFLDALGVPRERVPAHPDAQAALYRSLLAGRRMLVVLDNARDAAHARPLLPGTATCLTLVTSRDQLTGLVATGAQPLRLDPLSRQESRDLLAGRLGGRRVAAEPEATDRIVAACAQLPLALAIAAARAQQSTFPLADLAGELDESARLLDALDTGETSTQLRAVFSWSYTALTPPAARVFRLLGVHPGPDASAPAVASLAGIELAAVRPLLAELTRASLVGEQAPGRYALHDLLRLYVRQLPGAEADDDPQSERRGATRRLLDHYTHAACAAALCTDPLEEPIVIPLDPPADGVRPERPTDRHRAARWLADEHAVLLAALQRAEQEGYHRQAWQLAWALRLSLQRSGRWDTLEAVAQVALRSAQALADPRALASTHRLLARTDTLLGRYPAAHAQLQAALDLYQQAADPSGQALVHSDLGMLRAREGQVDRALHHAQQFLVLARAADNRYLQAKSLNAMGWYRSLLGEHSQAIKDCEQALGLLRNEVRDPHVEAGVWDTLGRAHSHLGQHEQAVGCYQRALALLHDPDYGDRRAMALTALGDAHERVGERAAAHQAWRQALEILTDLGHPDAKDVRGRLERRRSAG